MTHTNVQTLLSERARISGHAHADSTLRAYCFDWQCFTGWCNDCRRAALPASDETVLLYLTDVITSGLKISTANRRAAAINYHHREAGLPQPAETEIRTLLSGARRLLCEQQTKKLPLTVVQVRAMCALTWKLPDRRSVRNQAILTLGFCSALRRSNLVSLLFEDIHFVDRGLVVHVRREKNDQEGHGRDLAIAHGIHPESCAVASLARWVAIRGEERGFLFTPIRGAARRLNEESIAQVVKAAARSIALDPALYSGHSMRSGFISEAIDAGASTLIVARQSGHRSLDSLRRYYRSADLFRANPTTEM